ncbi:hypothetical protein EXIGLDRAFT_673383 [Exidia glandulosa HHB12029]|uniref:Large ribosomal subunit protein mL46 n=1 Tax=Exidia glandulosa HHB12029 TaxID=1314781 RepID=A0A165IY27_EXIGL|nr:hypothetical protein EXIGLDRAFT_673383 [Exidia glandulosa HHB12029]
MSSGCSSLLRSQKRVNAARFLTRGQATGAASRSRLHEHIPDHPHKHTHRLCVGLVLNRAPVLTAWPTHFERSFYKYQSRLARALSNPFPYDFYFPPGSLYAVKFRQEEFKRDSMAFGHEFLLRERLQARKTNKLLEALEEEGSEAAAQIKPTSRTSEADVKGDLSNLNRQGDRNLYLMLGGTHDRAPWHFPYGGVNPEEKLQEALQRHMDDQLGIDMDTWLVTHKPIGVLDQTHKLPVDGKKDDKVFFLKAHILAGQVKLKRPGPRIHPRFAWLTKQEIEKRCEPEYYAKIKDMLSEQ